MTSLKHIIFVIIYNVLVWKVNTAAVRLDCGRQLARKSKVIAGTASYPGEFPWLVAVIAPNISKHMTHRCGASILNKRWIVTAAHCKYDNERANDYLIRIKAFKVHPEQEDKIILQKVEKVVQHPDYGTPMSFSNDIALMKLKNDIDFDKLSWPICLPESSFNTTGKEGIVAGWGTNAEKSNVMSKILKKIKVPIISNNLCNAWYYEKGFKYSPVQDSELCAGYEKGGMDSCQGDSGGPLFLKNDNRFTIVGIVSHAPGCAQAKQPGIYARITSYLPWIESNIWDTN